MPPNDSITRDSLQIARLEEQMNTMRRDMESMSAQMVGLHTQLDAVLEKLSEFKGGRKVMFGLFGAVGAIASAITFAISHIRFQ